MAARTLVQALEGVNFPCDRAQLLDYARRNNLGEGTLEALKGIPDRNYRDLGEVFTALPGRPGPGREEREAEDEAAEQPGEAEMAFPPLPMPPLAMPMEWWMAGWRQMIMPWDVAAQCMRSSAETWPQWLRLTRHLWFPWSKE